jgi:hypothetical protein
MMATEPAPPAFTLPEWAREVVRLYESDSASQFIIYGNIFDQIIMPVADGQRLGSLSDYLMQVLLSRFQVVISYDIGNGIRVEKGGEVFSKWPHFQQSSDLPRVPRPAVEYLTSYFRYAANLARLSADSTTQVACIVRNANLLAPMVPGALDYDLSAIASLIRDWASESLLTMHSLATFLIVENLSDLHPLIANNSRAARCKIAMPSESELGCALNAIASQYPSALAGFRNHLGEVAGQFVGATLCTVEAILKVKEHAKQEIVPDDLARMKKQLIEQDCNGLIEFIQPSRTLDDLYGMENAKAWLRQDITLWQKNDLQAIPKGYLLCGPVGTGKTFLVECLAGEAGVPVVKLKNFRDKWVGSTEGNLEKIFRLLQAMGRAYVFIDEADQAIGRRQTSDGDSGISGRIYSMLAEEMGSSTNRGKLIWVLASSRPDLIEVDLKRPGRVDVKIPLFPTVDARASFELLRMLCRRRGMDLSDESFAAVEANLPLLLTPGAAEAFAVKLYRVVHTQDRTPLEALQEALVDYQNPIPLETLRLQIDIAVREASDLEFVPVQFRNH